LEIESMELPAQPVVKSKKSKKEEAKEKLLREQ